MSAQDLLQAAPIPMLVIGRGERIEAMNEKARLLFGAGAAGRHYVTIIRQPILLDAIDLAIRSGKPQNARFLSTEAQKDMTWVAHVAPIGTTGDLLLSFEDLTATEAAGEMRRDFVANVSHELRTPLTALLGFIETLRGAARNDPQAQARFLEIMEREALRMNRLVKDLLSLNRVESEERLRPQARVDVAALARSALHALAPVAADAGVSVTSENLDRAAEVLGDADQISQVLTNLLENAIKYSGRGRSVKVSIQTADNHPMVRGPAVILGVSDTGDGIDPVHIPRLTERFYRIDSHRSREMGGTGLGLAIVKHIVNRHRGRLRIESTPGKGSVFSVILPAFQELAEGT